MENAKNSGAEVLKKVSSRLASLVVSGKCSLGDAEIRIAKSNIKEVFSILKKELDYNFFVNVTAVDYMDTEFMEREDEDDERFELVYHLLALASGDRLRVKVSVPENDMTAASVTDLWPGANFMESEVWDMFGISFEGHPHLRRILMYDEFKGFPLRKDYPVQGKQPRVKLIKPEVENTARHMLRPNLVQINRRTD